MKVKILFSLFLFVALGLFVSKNIFARDGGPAANDPDVNIRIRGWQSTNFSNQLIDHPQNTDTKQPQLSSSFSPDFSSFFQINSRSGSGLDSSNLSSPGMATIKVTNGDDIKAPVTGRGIGGGLNYVILYATATDIVIHNGLEDSVVSTNGSGYTIHFLNINVNPTLLDMYNKNEADGRKQLVAIPCRYLLGSANGDPSVSIRDSGSFMDIRFKDWWGSTSSGTCQDVAATTILPTGLAAATGTEPYDLTNEIPCNLNTRRGPFDTLEYHSLRPYPASPCDKQLSDQTLLCSNDLVVVKSTSPGANGTCTVPDGNGSYTCTYRDVPQSVNVSIDLSDAELPIMGNTEDVPNATWTSPNTGANNLTEGQRVNNYVSWYLNGVVNRAEEDFSSIDSKLLVNYSGPLNKLLPWAEQAINRIATIDKGEKSLSTDPAVSATDKNARHDQIANCVLPGQNGSMPCYLYTLERFINLLKFIDPNLVPSENGLGQIPNNSTEYHLDQWLKPPLESDSKYKSFEDYWKDYLSWAGQICTPKLFGTKFYICPLDLPGVFQNWARFFAYIPSSSTEDRVGTIGTNPSIGGSCKVTGAPCSVTCNDADSHHFQDSCPGSTTDNPGGTFASCDQWAAQACAGVHGIPTNNPNTPFVGGITTTNSNAVTFTPSGGTNYEHNLYFAHMQEDAELASQLQNTFKSTFAESKSDTNTKAKIGAGCVIQPTDARTNPGDNLYGNIDRLQNAKGVKDTKIDGAVHFNATYTCTFGPVTSNGIVIGGTSVICSKAMASLSIFTQTPEVQNNWDSLVGGSQSIFKRFYPQVGVNAPVTEIKETPAYTQATYNATDSNGVAAGSQTTAGDGGKSAQANVYFPYIGGIKDYFLEGIQLALRPKGFNSDSNPGSGTPPPSSTTVNCDTGVADSAIPAKYLGSYKTNIISLADRWVGNGVNHGKECYNDVVKRSLLAGVNPAFTLLIWLNESDASNYDSTATSNVTQDFGINDTTIANNFNAQITRFLALPNATSYINCSNQAGWKNRMQAFLVRFQSGQCDPNNQSGNAYYQGFAPKWNWVAPSCSNLISYPTDMSCP